jgi:Cache domain
MLFEKPSILLCLLTMSIIVSIDIINSSSNALVESANAQSTIDSIRGLQNGTAQSTVDRSLIVKLLADNLEDRLNKSAAILEITSRLPELKNVSYANSIDTTLHGIPQDLDIEKRKIAQDILTADRDFRVIVFLLPNGDIYLQEPYSNQQNLTRNNFAFRDYYRGAVSTGETYLGNVVISSSSGLAQANMAVPIYSAGNNSNSDNATSLSGVWAGGLNLTVFSESLQSLNLTNEERIVYVDQYGQKIADSDKELLFNRNQNESFTDLQSFKNAVKGESGSIIEVINGTEMLVMYEPAKFYGTTWAVLLMQPYYPENNMTSLATNTVMQNSLLAGEEEEGEEIFITQNTSMSAPAPVRHPGQPPHEVVFALPLRDDGKIWSGRVTFTASKPIEAEILHIYNPQQPIDEKHDEPYHAVLPGNRSVAISHLRDLVDVPIEINGTGISSGSFEFEGNALVFHKTSGEPFTVTYTVNAVAREINK